MFHKHPKEQHIYVGIDLHKEHHTAVIINCWTDKLGEINFENKPAAFPELLKTLKKHTPKGVTAVYGLEDVNGHGRALAMFLLEKKSIVRDIRFKKAEIVMVEERLAELMKLLDYRLDTMPGINLVTSSSLVKEIGDIRRFSHPDKLARFAGIAPVNFSSGGKGKDQKSKQGNRILHGLFHNLAVQQVQVSKGSGLQRNPVFYQYYKRKLAEGKTKGQALVCIMRRLVNIIYGMMKNKTAYVAPPLPLKIAG